MITSRNDYQSQVKVVHTSYYITEYESPMNVLEPYDRTTDLNIWRGVFV